jgi:hypothetical protein
MSQFTISGRKFALEPESIKHCMHGLLPDPLHEHYVVVEGRRFPPKQVIACATGLDRADFTTHQARRILRRLGFVAARVGHDDDQPPPAIRDGPHRGHQAAVLSPYVGQWVALAGPTEVLVAADTPQEVISWLNRHERRADYGMFRVPGTALEAEGAGPG